MEIIRGDFYCIAHLFSAAAQRQFHVFQVKIVGFFVVVSFVLDVSMHGITVNTLERSYLFA